MELGFIFFSHGGYSKANGEGIIFGDANEHPDADNVYTSDLYQIGNSFNNGDLEFTSDSVIYLGGRNVSTVYNGQSFAMELALWTGSKVYGAADRDMNVVNPIMVEIQNLF